MQLFIRPGDDLPIYRQIMRQIMDAIAGGRLTAGDQLPSHRDLSEQLVIAPLTVKKAYDELEALGYIGTQRGRGTFVAARLPRAAAAVQIAQIEEAARALVSQAYLAGMRLPKIVELIKDADREISAGPTLHDRKERNHR